MPCKCIGKATQMGPSNRLIDINLACLLKLSNTCIVTGHDQANRSRADPHRHPVHHVGVFRAHLHPRRNDELCGFVARLCAAIHHALGGDDLAQAAIKAEDPLNNGSEGNPAVRVILFHVDRDRTTAYLAGVLF